MNEKRVLFNIDDIGSSYSTNMAVEKILDKGVIKSGSLMVPGKGFDDAVKRFGRSNKLDLGVHLVLTSEWNKINLYTRPTLGDLVPSLMNNEGKFYGTIDEVFSNAKPEEIYKELINQIQIAFNAGLNITHIDSHMGVLLHRQYFEIYKDISIFSGLQPFLFMPGGEDLPGSWFFDCEQYVDKLRSYGFFIFDDYDSNGLYNGEKPFEHHKSRLENIQEGTTYFLLHVLDSSCDKNDKTPDYRARLHEYNFFSSNLFETLLDNEKINPITYSNLEI